MSITQVATALYDELHQYPWFVSLGIGTLNDHDKTLYVYTTVSKNKVLENLKDGYQGFPVVIKRTGRFRLAATQRTP